MKLRAVTAFCIAILGLISCRPGEHRADLVFINGAEPETLDPALITGQPEGRAVSALFEGLCAFDSAARPVPGVAEEWKVSPDGKTYTFRIRADALWSDGRPLTAHDFVQSWRRVLEPETAAAYSYQLYPVKNAQPFAEGRLTDFSQVGVRAPDDRTLEVELESPTPYFLELTAFPTLYPVPLHVVAQAGDDWIKPGRIVGNGAFVLEDWRINDRIRLRKNPHYWNRDRVELTTVDVLPIADANAAFNFYASGQADLVMDKGLAPPALLEDLKIRPDFHSAPFLGVYFLRFNCAKGPFQDPRVRRAFSLAVDKKRIVEKITRAGEPPASGFVPPGIKGYGIAEGLPHDPMEAARLLAEAGYPDGKGFPLVRYLYSKSEMNEAIAIELQNMWRETLGVTVDLARQEWKVYLNSLELLDYDIARSSWVGDYPDPNTFLDLFVTGGGNNRTGWSNPSYDALLLEASREVDPPRRFATLLRAEQLLVGEGLPVCPLYFYVGIQLYDPLKLQGVEPNVLDEHPLRLIRRTGAPGPASQPGILK